MEWIVFFIDPFVSIPLIVLFGGFIGGVCSLQNYINKLKTKKRRGW